MVYLLPFCTAFIWALCYVFLEQSLTQISMATWCFLSGLVWVAAAFIITFAGGEALSFRPLLNGPALWVVTAAVVAALLGELCTLYVIRDVSATYAAIGGLLILAGAFILVSGNLQRESADKNRPIKTPREGAFVPSQTIKSD